MKIKKEFISKFFLLSVVYILFGIFKLCAQDKSKLEGSDSALANNFLNKGLIININ